ncbi:hypothetical protein HK100_000555 [Physocladia obscura]|uniref:Uncharacterized protein n=1 Tax=Physocladia obscura TaxID=109957 RepID=A0AAD5TAD1_9FUNG|nr:hypothetical protein HK100_000555 [Physocladia obscura]
MARIKPLLDRRVVVVTGANAGIGLAISQHLVTYFGSARIPVVLVLACRNLSRAVNAQHQLRQLAIEYNKNDNYKDSLIQIETLQCNLSEAKQVLTATVEFKRRYGRLDAFICNAGMIPVERFSLPHAILSMLRNPANFAQTTADAIIQRIGVRTADSFAFGEAFAANFLGHYIFLKEVENLMQKTTNLLKDENYHRGSSVGSRVVWMTSDTAEHKFFDFSDIQCLKGNMPYESSKRLIEIMHMQTYASLKKKGIYSCLVNPGISATDITQGLVPMFLVYFALYFLRCCGLPGVCATPQNAATSAVHLAVKIENLDAVDPDTVYQSDVSFWGKPRIRKLKLDKTGVRVCDGDICTFGDVDASEVQAYIEGILETVKNGI